MKDRQAIHEKWDAIPESVDVLITHGPPLGRGDKVFLGGSRAGCANLLSQIQTRIRPRLCVYGHIHEDAGVTFDGKTLYVNAANVTMRYNPQQPCVVIDLPSDPKEVARVVRPRCKLTGEEILSWLENHGYKDILPFFERCDPLLDGNDLIGPQQQQQQQQQPNFEMLTEKLKLNQQFLQRDFVSSFTNNAKKIKEELITAMLHLQSISYD
jgi:Predicted phosphoesterases, related to the Icc protein